MLKSVVRASHSPKGKLRWLACRGATPALQSTACWPGDSLARLWALVLLLVTCVCKVGAGHDGVADAPGANAHMADTAPPLPANNVSYQGVIDGSQTKYFRLSFSECDSNSILNLEALNKDRQDEILGTAVIGQAGLMLMVNVLGEAPDAIPLGSGLWKWNDGTVADYKAYRLVRWYQLLHFNLSELNLDSSPTWIVGLMNDNSWASLSLNFSLRAWCSRTPSCPMNCRGVGRCTPEGTCECGPGRGGRACGAIVTSLENGVPLASTLLPASWDYYTYNLTEPNQRFLVELSRTRGDPVLFVKQKLEGFVPGGVPTVFDFNSYADASSFRERLDHHYMVRVEAKPMLLTIGVFNNDRDFQETGEYSIQARAVPVAAIVCPLNCSYPNGECTAVANNSQCICREGFQGQYCEGTYSLIELAKPAKGTLRPGGWAFFRLSTQVETTEDIVITFARSGGQAILTAKLGGGMPTLEDNHYRFTSLEANGSLTSYFSMHDASQLASSYFAIYNMNYYAHTACQYTLGFSVGDGRGTSATASPILALVLALVASISLCICMGISRSLILRYQVRLGLQLTPAPYSAATGLDPKVVASFALVPFSEDLFTAKEDALCSICLGEYEASEVLRQLPKCSHYFHVQCIDAWLTKHTTCPVCRTSLQAQPSSGLPPDIPITIAEEPVGDEQMSLEVCHEVSKPELPSPQDSRPAATAGAVGSAEGRGKEALADEQGDRPAGSPVPARAAEVSGAQETAELEAPNATSGPIGSGGVEQGRPLDRGQVAATAGKMAAEGGTLPDRGNSLNYSESGTDGSIVQAGPGRGGGGDDVVVKIPEDAPTSR